MSPDRTTCDVVVVGTGVAGLACALELEGCRVQILTKTGLASGSSLWAQGGVAVAMGRGDSPELHAADTVAAGAGLVEPEVAKLLTRDGVRAVRRLIELGAEFDRARGGRLSFGREAAHSRRRILHAHGDSTGAELVRALAERVRTAPWIEIFEHSFAAEIVVEKGAVRGLMARSADGSLRFHEAPRVVLATGGLGQLFRYTTNPPESTGDGLALAAAAGARLVDVEFVQFHPTALAVDRDPLPLLTEALRGEGAILVDAHGERFMPAEHPDAELAPRDVVARAIWRRAATGGAVFLDARKAIGAQFPERFPTVFAQATAAGIDPRRDLLPVVPAAHYYMGGVAVDEWGASNVRGLWACGEVSATGVHGANRLASNSLLEALVFGARVAEAIEGSAIPTHGRPVALRSRSAMLPDPVAAAPEVRVETRRLAWEHAGLVRDRAGLERAGARFAELLAELPAGASEVRNLLVAGALVVAAAKRREESRGAHFRSDFPASSEAFRRRQFLVAELRAGEVVAHFEDAANGASDRRQAIA
ncbi:MAG: L-aspartate oxidase [Thermoanaerobaculia bacterium]